MHADYSSSCRAPRTISLEPQCKQLVGRLSVSVKPNPRVSELQTVDMHALPTCSSFALALTFLLLISAGQWVAGSRFNRDPASEPSSAQIHNIYRISFAHQNYYALAQAGLLKESDVPPEMLTDQLQPDGSFVKYDFSFNTSHFIPRSFNIKWLISLEDRLAMQIYDRDSDMELAAGPQVNQKLCGLHLDYMNHMAQNYMQNFTHSTEYSIFRIMSSFDMPRQGLSRGNFYFAGDHDLCVDQKLNVMRSELARSAGHSAANQYFRSLNKSQPAPSSWLNSLLAWLRHYLGPFVGLRRPLEHVKLDKYRDRLHGQDMRFCAAAIRWPDWPNSTHHKRNVNYRVATCLPKTCDSRSLELYRDKIKRLMDIRGEKYFDGYYIDQLYCLPDADSPFMNPFNYTSSRNFIIFNAIWLSLVLIVSLIDIARACCEHTGLATISSREMLSNPGTSKLYKLYLFLDCWSVRKNLRKFLTANRPKIERDQIVLEARQKQGRLAFDLGPFEGIKVLSAFPVIVAHACVIIFPSVWNPEVGHHIMSRTWMTFNHVICPASVNIFFVITGVLTMRILLKNQRPNLLKPTFWLQFVVYRYLRVVPLYLLLFWFMRSTYRFLGDGPYWDYGTSDSALVRMCQTESWWRVLLPTANFHSPGEHCLGVGWYLASDIQFALVTPFFIVPYLKSAFWGHLTVSVGVLFCYLNHIYYYYRVSGDPLGIFDWSLMTLTRVLNENSSGYVYPQYRCLAYLIGIATGYISLQYERGEIKKWPRWFVIFSKIYTFVLIYLLVFTTSITTIIPLYNSSLIRVLNALYNGSLHLIMSIGVALFTLLICTGYFRWYAKLMGSTFMKIMANTTLAETLIHIPLIFYHVQQSRSLPELNMHYVVTQTTTWFVEALIVAAIVHVIYELPMRRLTTKFLIVYSGSSSKKTTKANVRDVSKQKNN